MLFCPWKSLFWSFNDFLNCFDLNLLSFPLQMQYSTCRMFAPTLISNLVLLFAAFWAETNATHGFVWFYKWHFLTVILSYRLWTRIFQSHSWRYSVYVRYCVNKQDTKLNLVSRFLQFWRHWNVRIFLQCSKELLVIA